MFLLSRREMRGGNSNQASVRVSGDWAGAGGEPGNPARRPKLELDLLLCSAAAFHLKIKAVISEDDLRTPTTSTFRLVYVS